ncbi:MAG: hypothetical protein AB1679_16880 [Actinomycetota bacterium]
MAREALLEEPATTMTVTAGGQALAPERPVPVKGFIPRAAGYVSTTKGWLVGSTLSVDDPDPGLTIATSDGGRTWQRQFPA